MANTMSRLRTLVLPALASTLVALLFISSPARAADPEFKLLIPVAVKNLHPYVASIEVTCTPKDANGKWVSFDVAHSPSDRPNLDASGSFQGTVMTTMKMFDPADAAKVKSYSCFLRFWSNGIGEIPKDCADPMSNWSCLKPGTPRTLTVEGPIP